MQIIEIKDDNNELEEVTEKSEKEETVDEIKQLRDEISELNEKYLRALADMENLRKRNDLAVSNAHKFAVSDFAKEMLTILDVLSMALKSIDYNHLNENSKAIMTGVELTRTELEKSLDKFGVKKIDILHKAFDSHISEALGTQPHAELEDNIVCEVVEDGYMLHDRLLRASKVIIVKNNSN